MRILMIASEAAPFAQTGGLADVLGALPSALARLGHDVDVVIPRYRGIRGGSLDRRVTFTLAGALNDAAIWIDGSGPVRTVFVDQPAYFDREHLYGTASQDYPDNAERFASLSLAALEWAASRPHRFDIVHAHDWQAGLAPVLLRTGRAPARLAGTPTVITIHNLAYQGVFDASWLPRLGLGWDLMRIDALEYWGRISYLKGGIMFSQAITTVSPHYAQEIQGPEFGFGFDGILRYRSGDLVGILNGIDYDRWDPAHDRFLSEAYDARDLTGKAEAKRQVLRAFGLPAEESDLTRPLIGLISRLSIRRVSISWPRPRNSCRVSTRRSCFWEAATDVTRICGLRSPPGTRVASGFASVSTRRWLTGSKGERISF